MSVEDDYRMLCEEIESLRAEVESERSRASGILELLNAARLELSYANEKLERETMRADENARELAHIRETGKIPEGWRAALEAEGVLHVPPT